ncbi:ABC transporter permease [Aminobacter sp. MDW-2]|uniref:ABC transporter permease n=1 Tax=Aminobacter sp. MDW-2 TaxID=2666139 RepID=UPI0012AF2111|nr:ABC transporter permease [Aminobacter sp. MDW-2]MRX37578.1 ABC transporter permease [Aminobacter sp. MDW-2]QNH37888.1 ABC transporter permease [Aminobacter sp. MDW-2]
MREASTPDSATQKTRSPGGSVLKESGRRDAAHQFITSLTAPGSSLLLIIVIAVLIAVFAILLSDTAFLSVGNFVNILKAKTPLILMAIAGVFVISAGEIDLSVASVPPVAGIIAAALLSNDYSTWVAVSAGLSAGLAVGLINGLITVWVGIPSFIVTLGMIGVLQGLARLVSGERTIPILNETYTAIFGQGSFGPIPSLLIWTVAVGVVGAVVLRATAFGKAVLATGGNEVAARYSGIATGRIKITVLALSGLAGALAGLLYTGQFGSGRYDLGGNDLLQVLAAVIIGGTALSGGRGSVEGAIAGALLVGLVSNGVILLGFSTPQQQIFSGMIIVFAVALSGQRIIGMRSSR